MEKTVDGVSMSEKNILYSMGSMHQKGSLLRLVLIREIFLLLERRKRRIKNKDVL
jgi:hypothetical protein